MAALSRLLLPKLESTRFCRRGVPNPTRWVSSSPRSSDGKLQKSLLLKEMGAVKEEDAPAPAGSDMGKYTKVLLGSYCQAPAVQNVVGSSGKALKGVFTSLKEIFLGKSQSSPNESTVHIDDRPTSNMATTQHAPDFSVFQASESTAQSPEEKMNSLSRKNKLSECVALRTGMPSINMLSETASDDMKVNGGAYNTDEPKPLSLKTLSNPSKKISTSGAPSLVEVKSSEDLVNGTVHEAPKLEIDPHSSSLADSENKVQSSEVSLADYVVQSEGKFYGPNLAEGDMDKQTKDIVFSILSSLDQGHTLSSGRSSCSEQFIPSTEASWATEIAYRTKLPTSGYTRHSDKENVSVLIASPAYESDHAPPPSGGTCNPVESEGMFMRTASIEASDEVSGGVEKSIVSNKSAEFSGGRENSIISKRFAEFTSDIAVKDVSSVEVNSLLDCIKLIYEEEPGKMHSKYGNSNGEDHFCSQGKTSEFQSRINVQKSDGTAGEIPLNNHKKDVEHDKLDYSKGNKKKKKEKNPKSPEVDKMNIEVNTQVSVQVSTEIDPQATAKVIDENKVLVRFLNKNLREWDIISAFQDCGGILDVLELPNLEEDKFKNAYIYFKTREGMLSALERTNVIVGNNKISDVTVEDPLEGAPGKVSIPPLIGYPGVPAVFLKNPMHTAVIRNLTSDINSSHLKKALAFCGSKISGIFFGSSSSVAFVEFEEEAAKERALAKHSISIMGKRLLVYRIDAPRTTVLRISNVKPTSRVHPIVTACGQTKKINYRARTVVDVHFKLSEWPNMLNILNGLNGRYEDGNQWVARPASIYPPEIFQVLWNQPDERRRLVGVTLNLLNELDGPVGAASLAPLMHKYCKYEA